MLSRILACGNEEARAYALALLANAEDAEGLEDVQDELDRLKLKAR
jgi:F0F1-type ATP synthase delta subunit